MSDAMGISTAGLLNSASRYDSDATAIVKASSPIASTSGNLENAVVSQISDSASYKANATVLKATDSMMGTLLNLTT